MATTAPRAPGALMYRKMGQFTQGEGSSERKPPPLPTVVLHNILA